VVKAPKRSKLVLGWREWVELPDLGASPIKAKIDTGARTSALHAFGLSIEQIDGAPFASFELHPIQRSDADAVAVQCPVLDFRRIRSSNGKIETRPVIATTASVGDVSWPIEVSLTSRDAMGFRMLLGRVAVRRRFLVDPGRSFLLSRPKGPPT
jgi:hypothetical protein